MINNCLICNKEFIIYLSNYKRGYSKFCSRKCYEISRRNKPLSEEWKRKISIANKGKKKPKGFAEKCRQRMIGTKMSLTTRKNLSNALKGRKAWNKGIKMSKEFCRKNSIAHKGMPSWNKGKKYPQITGSKNPNWKGGRYKGNNGYVLIKVYNHPFAMKSNYIKRSRYIMEKHLGRFLKPEEVIHHINHNKSDDRIENLMLFKSNGSHRSFHRWKHYNPKNIISDGSKVNHFQLS